ncbi:MAG: hypothetical protein EKK65_02355 [Lysobacterales bacterium]|nr:MAG: hypothetical protein EKK65_02355 [Xanthomonadales bacterium]
MAAFYDALETRSPEARLARLYDALPAQVDRARAHSPAYARLLGSLDLHAPVADPRTQTDVFGLSLDHPSKFDAHARIAAELAQDFPPSDLPPALAQALRSPLAAGDRQARILAALRTPPRPTCG